MPDTVRIGLSISTRINAPANTLPTYRGFLLAMEKIANAGDLPVAVEWTMLDDDGNPEQSRSLAEAVAADPSYVGIVGPMGSTEAFANAPVFDEAGLLQVSPCGSHPDLCRRGYNTFFRLVPNEQVQGTELARVAHHHLGALQAAVVHDADAFGTSVADNFESGYALLGGKIIARESFAQGEDDYGSIADAVAASGADIVFFAVHAHEGGAVSKAIRDRGMGVPFLGTDGLKTSFFLGGGEPGAEAYHTHSGCDFSRMPSATDFRNEYISRFPPDSTYSPEAYDSAMMVVDAIRRADDTSREAVLAAFISQDRYDGITGTVKFDPTGERLNAPVSFYRVRKTGDGRIMEYQGLTSELASI